MTKILIALLLAGYHIYLARLGLTLPVPWNLLTIVIFIVGLGFSWFGMRSKRELKSLWLLSFAMLCCFATSHVLAQNGSDDRLARGMASGSWLTSIFVIGMLTLFQMNGRVKN